MESDSTSMSLEQDRALFQHKMTIATKNVISSAHELFEPTYLASTQRSAMNFANSLEALLESAPHMAPIMEDTLDHSRESVRQFIKTASQLYGSIGTSLELNF